MNERSYSVKIIDGAKSKFRGAEILKVADRFTRGIPDIEILWLDTCSWIETKLLRKTDKLKDILRMDQLVKCHQLGTVCGGRSYVVIYNVAKDRTEVWLPRVLAAHVWPRVVGEGIVDPYGFEPDEVESSVVNFHQVLLRHGMVWTEGWSVPLALRMVLDGIKARRA
jgi:hypothetical protein